MNESTDHYKEFMDVMRFLFYDYNKQEAFEKVWQDYSSTLCEISKDSLTVLVAKKNIAENALYQGVCRTERFSNGIIDDSSAAEVPISDSDILSFCAMQSLLDEMSVHSRRPLRYRNVPMDYAKSSPYLLSFMESYQLKKQITDYFTTRRNYDFVKEASNKYLLLKKSAIHSYQPIPSNNARLSKLKEIVFENGKNGAENLLWIPASKAYYRTGSVFDQNKDYSKVLVFSSWEMVPRMVSVM
ncbi:MAG: helicase, partial [Hydrogenoanaerobacterium sp.]